MVNETRRSEAVVAFHLVSFLVVEKMKMMMMMKKTKKRKKSVIES
jgi:hypothetical protein